MAIDFTKIVTINTDFVSQGPKLMAESKAERPSVNGALVIKGYSFSKYIERRLSKDGLGFVPTQDLMDGVAYSSHIQAIIPKTPSEFLVYCHELGHLKSKQYQRERSSMLLGGVCEATLENELNAWLWGIRYYKRLGFNLCKQSHGLIKKAFESYLNQADRKQAERVAHILYRKTGVQCVLREPIKTEGLNPFSALPKPWLLDEFTSVGFPWPAKTTITKPKQKEKKVKPLPKNWKPWHDLREKDVKRQWKNKH